MRVALNCSESELTEQAELLAKKLKSGDRVLLEGLMGAGKSTFAKALLKGLGIHQPAEGSPSFAIAHEYDSSLGSVIHIDYYRIRSESEIEDAGIHAYYWERPTIVISEWLSSWPEFERAVIERTKGRIWKVSLSFIEDLGSQRHLEITSN